MKNGQFGILFFLLVVFSVSVFAATTNTTTMTWVVPANKSHTIAYGGSCSASNFFFVESNGEDSDTDGNSAKILPYTAAAAGTACQSNTVAGMTITNNGNVTINIDANFQTNFSGTDINAHLKVWMGTGSGCGTGGLGGWQKNCTVFAAGSPVTSTTCRDFNYQNATTTARLTSSLLLNDTNQLCYSGEIDCNGSYNFSNCLVQGSYAHNFDTNAS